MSKRTSGVLAMTLLVACALPALAAESSDGQSTATKVNQSALEWSDLTANERTRAEVWGLSATEWGRYRSLMEGIRGSISPGTISPIEVLGIHARDDAERRRYAEQWAVMMREDAERILAFQRAYDQAGRLLYPRRITDRRGPAPRSCRGRAGASRDGPCALVRASRLCRLRCDPLATAGEARPRGGCRRLPRQASRPVTRARSATGPRRAGSSRSG